MSLFCRCKYIKFDKIVFLLSVYNLIFYDKIKAEKSEEE